MRINKNYFLAFVVVLSLSIFLFKYNNNNKLVIAADNSVPSVVSVMAFRQNIYRDSVNGIGSGVIFSEDGYIVTNFHVISGSQNILITLNNGSEFEAKIIGIDKNSDIAILKINSEERLNPINFADSENLKVGDEVLAIGNPYGIGLSVSSGIISATGRDYGNPYLELIQTDAVINPGNSGGALINVNGNLIGINAKIFSKTGAYQGIGFAIPSKKVVQIATELIKYGKVRNVWIGRFRVARTKTNIDSTIIESLKIVEIQEKGPLFENNVRVGDIIIKINDKNASWANLTQTLNYSVPGDTIEMDIVSNNKIKKLNIKSQAIN